MSELDTQQNHTIYSHHHNVEYASQGVPCLSYLCLPHRNKDTEQLYSGAE